MIRVTARYTVPPAAADACKDAVRELVESVRTDEPETLSYTVLFDEGEARCHFLHVGAFASPEGFEAHRRSRAMRVFLDLVYPVTVDGVDFVRHEVVDRIAERAAPKGRLRSWGGSPGEPGS